VLERRVVKQYEKRVVEVIQNEPEVVRHVLDDAEFFGGASIAAHPI
jgi:hypothetical protein